MTLSEVFTIAAPKKATHFKATRVPASTGGNSWKLASMRDGPWSPALFVELRAWLYNRLDAMLSIAGPLIPGGVLSYNVLLIERI
jgi:hypothetical protein